MTDRIVFGCAKCGSSDVRFSSSPPKDDDDVICAGCGHTFGTLAVVRAAMVAEGKSQIEKVATEIFGKPIKFD